MNREINRLATFLLKNFPDEIGKGDPVHGEGAVDVAIRLLELNMEDAKIKYYHCLICKIAFGRFKVNGEPRTACPKCGSTRITGYGGSFLETKGVWFNPSER